ncbi:MAG: hypothetical protein K2X66_19010 [Cyanobacteria bacterium]|nr:hypothetical protein [Cyanobacteriota bacterium]
MTQVTGGNGKNDASITPASMPFSTLPGKIVQLDLGNGKSLNLNYPNPAAVADTAGGNGVTENALSLIKQIAQQLRDQGEDPTKIVELEKLALAGQKIKDLQKQIETKFPIEGFTSDQDRFNFLNDPANNILVEGKETTLLDASAMLSVYNNNNNPKQSKFENYNYNFINNNNKNANNINYYNFNYDYFINSNKFTQTPLYNFMGQLKTVESTGLLLSNPLLKQLVKDDLSFQIFNSANQTVRVPTKSDVSELVKTTRAGSNDICTLSKSTICQDKG